MDAMDAYDVTLKLIVYIPTDTPDDEVEDLIEDAVERSADNAEMVDYHKLGR